MEKMWEYQFSECMQVYPEKEDQFISEFYYYQPS